jgi:hypothetical protein
MFASVNAGAPSGRARDGEMGLSAVCGKPLAVQLEIGIAVLQPWRTKETRFELVLTADFLTKSG